MASVQLVKTLSQKYARLRGEYEHADQEIEGIFGLDAIDAATGLILKRKAEIHKQLDAIEIVIHLFDPGWDFASVKPIKPVKRKHKPGSIAQLAYEVLRENNNEPMTIAKIARAVVTKLGAKNPDEDLVDRYRTNISNTFTNRPDVVKMLEGLPRRWMLRNFVPIPSRDAFSSSRPKIEKQDARLRRARQG